MSENWQDLAREMSEISEQAYCAGWMDGLEYRLWEILQGGSKKYGQIRLSDAQVARLRELASKVGGWVRLDDEAEVEEFVEMADWQNLYEAWARKKSSRESQG